MVVVSEGEVSYADRACVCPVIDRRKAEGMTRVSASCLPFRRRSYPPMAWHDVRCSLLATQCRQ